MATTALQRQPGLPGKRPETKRQRLNVMYTQMKNARTSFESHWRELGEFFRPRRVRLQSSDRNRGDKRNQKILDSTGLFSARTLASGMMSGITSPARLWFRMTLTDKELLEHESVKIWLEEVRTRMAAVLLRSNFYSVLSPFYSDLGVFATSAMIVEEDTEKIIRCTHFAIGEYWVAYNAKQQVRVFMREFEMTVRQVVEQFGQRVGDTIATANLSETVQSSWRNGTLEDPVTVVQIIYENGDYDETKLLAKHKRFASCYYERGGKTDVFLDEGGFDEWPVMAVRWEVTSGDVYGTESPGMIALADSKELMFSKKTGAHALHKSVNPPMVADSDMANKPLSILPGGVTYVKGDDVRKKFAAAIDTSQFRLDYLSVWVKDIRDLIKRAFYEDLFLMITAIDRGDVTATEILEKKEEKLLSLGPVLEQVNGGFLDPFFDRLYGIMLRRGEIPEPPPELDGVEFHPEYESVMAQAQRAQGRAGIESFLAFYESAAKDDPTVRDRVDTDEMVKRYAEVSGVPPKFIRSDEGVAAIRQTRAQAQAKQAAAEQAKLVSDSANKLANSPTTGGNALSDLLASGGASNVLSAAPGPQGGF